MSRSRATIHVAVIGAGTRGTHLAQEIMKRHPDVTINAVAEPDEYKRKAMEQTFGINPRNVFANWPGLFESGTGCNAAIIATKDHLHTGPVLAAIKKGWHILLEKPMAHTFENCLKIRDAWTLSGSVISVCHTLRYRMDFNQVKSLVAEGAIGTIKSIEHREGIEPIRFTHNYVRGKWAREKDNTFLLLHKSSHDLDFMAWLIDQPCLRVSSFGGRTFFHTGHAPKNTGKRCLEQCPVETTCMYSARKIYLDRALTEWPARDITPEQSRDAMHAAIKTGPYGRCVWHCDNDVVDQQVVAMEFKNGAFGLFNLTGLSGQDGRHTHIFGTEGNLVFNEADQRIAIHRFGESPAEIALQVPEGYHPEDRDIVKGWLKAIHSGDFGGILVDPEEALKTHVLAFAAEHSRNQGRTVEIGAFPYH